MRNNSISELLKTFPDSKKIEKYSIEKPEDHKTIIHNFSYLDFTPRTLKGIKKDDVTDALDYLAKRTYRYFTGKEISQKEFDKWHKGVCTIFISKLPEKHRQWGKAQKILNMTMKYLFCLSDAGDGKYAEKFKCCHMPLDTYVINWFCDTIAERGTKTKIREIPWSNLKYGDENEKFSYMWFQSKIREYLINNCSNKKYRDESEHPLTPLEAEFYIWQEQKFISAYKSIIDLDVFKDNYPKYQDDDLYKMCEELSIKISGLKEKTKQPNA